VCPTCGELLEDDWRQCPVCEETFGPSEAVENAAAEAEAEITDTALDEDLSTEERTAMKAILAAVDDPTALAESLSAATDGL
jgi:integrase/recombinase XerD